MINLGGRRQALVNLGNEDLALSGGMLTNSAAQQRAAQVASQQRAAQLAAQQEAQARAQAEAQRQAQLVSQQREAQLAAQRQAQARAQAEAQARAQAEAQAAAQRQAQLRAQQAATTETPTGTVQGGGAINPIAITKEATQEPPETTSKWGGTRKEAEEMYNVHPRMQQIFPTLDDYIKYLDTYQGHLDRQEQAGEGFAERAANLTANDITRYDVDPDFDWQTDWNPDLDQITENLSNLDLSGLDPYNMEAAFGNSFAGLGTGGGFGGSGSGGVTTPSTEGIQSRNYAPTVLEPLGLDRENFSSFREGDNVYVWNGTTFEKRDVGQSDFSKAVRGSVAVGLALGLGPQVGAALGVGSTGLVGGAISGAAGSAISQGIMTGSIDADQLATSAIIGGIGGLAEAARAGEIAGSSLDNAIWDLSDTLGVDYETTANVLEGAATGAAQGGDVEDIVANAVGSWSTEKLQSFVSDTYGDVIDVDNFFREGTTSIDSEALYPLIEAGVNAAVEGGMDPKDALLSTLDYFSEGGSLDFILPGLPQIAEGVGIDLPDIDLSGFNIDFGNLPDLPSIPFSLGDLPDIPNFEFEDLNSIDLGDWRFDGDFDGFNFDVGDLNINGFNPNINGFNVNVNGFDANLENHGSIDVGELNVDTPEIDTPDVDLPDVDLPDLDLPGPNDKEGNMFEKKDRVIPSISYQAPSILPLIESPQVDYVGELNNIINRSLFEGII